jgi:hypothetical protein
MIYALLVVLFSVITALVGWLTYRHGTYLSDDEYYGAFRDGLEDGANMRQPEIDALEHRVSTLNSLLEAATKLSDEYKRELNSANIDKHFLFAALNKARTERGKAVNLLGKCIEYCNALSALVDAVSAESLLKEMESQQQIDGLTVELAATEHERDEAKATVEKLTKSRIAKKK